MQRNLKLIIAYDGTDLHGWQRQPDVRTVQEDVEQVARRVLREPIAVVGASRTDAGVHARGQVAHIRTATHIPAENLRRAIAHRLPRDIALVHLDDVPLSFHATRSARGKLYRYSIHAAARRPVEQLDSRTHWHMWFPLDLKRMRAAARLLVGTHDFAGFATAGCVRRTTVRTIFRIDVTRRYGSVQFAVSGDGFLYNQVRNIVGTLVEIGRGHWPPERVREVLDQCDRRLAGPTAPAHGLCLEWVRYPPLRSLENGA